jgi:hypothetical protein
MGGVLYDSVGFTYTFVVASGLLAFGALVALLFLPGGERVVDKDKPETVIHFTDVIFLANFFSFVPFESFRLHSTFFDPSFFSNPSSPLKVWTYGWVWLGLLAIFIPLFSVTVYDPTLQLHLAPFSLTHAQGMCESDVHVKTGSGKIRSRKGVKELEQADAGGE